MRRKVRACGAIELRSLKNLRSIDISSQHFINLRPLHNGRKPNRQQVRFEVLHLQIQRDEFSPGFNARFLIDKPQFITQHKVRFVKFHLADARDSFLNIRTMDVCVQSTQ